MINNSLTKTPIKEQEPTIRNCNFDEVSLGYTEEEAISEARRCLNCKAKPCVSGCPVRVNIPNFIKEVAEGNFEGAYEIISKDNFLPAVCGRVCPQESQCEAKCVRAIKGESVAIGRLERFIADYHNKQTGSKQPVKNHKNGKVAVVGSGPSGLTCAAYLAEKGYAVTVFEALHLAGGVLVYGIPEFRLPKSIVESEISRLKELGVELRLNTVIGKSFTVDELMEEEGFDAVFIGSGAGLPKFMNVEGENYNGVFAANEFLTRINLMKAYETGSKTPVYRGKKVAVLGGGNVAMDCARCAKRLGADVTVLYRRTENELPARKEEIHHAKEEGINFKFLVAPLKILADEKGWASGVVLQEMKLSEIDASGRARPIPVEGSESIFEADSVIVAIGTSPNPLIKATTKGLETQKWGGIVADETTGKTSKEGVYAGGDAVTGAATVILAMGAGKSSAAAIDEYLTSKLN